jgi:hypothetical protein
MFQVFKDGWERISRALEIYSGMGMKVSGLHTCGDYMFSGHTVTITLLIFLINECTYYKSLSRFLCSGAGYNLLYFSIVSLFIFTRGIISEILS